VMKRERQAPPQLVYTFLSPEETAAVNVKKVAVIQVQNHAASKLSAESFSL